MQGVAHEAEDRLATRLGAVAGEEGGEVDAVDRSVGGGRPADEVAGPGEHLTVEQGPLGRVVVAYRDAGRSGVALEQFLERSLLLVCLSGDRLLA